MTDFSQIVTEEDAQVAGGGGGGGFIDLPAAEGVALFRLKDILELGTVMGEYAGKPKENKPVVLTFELVHPRHAIKRKAEGDPAEGPFTGDFVRNHEVTVRLNKSNSDRSKYMKLFNKMNFDGAVATPKGKVPSFVAFAGKGFLGAVHHNTSKDGTKVYVNLDKDGEYTIGAARIAETDDMGAPTGNYKAVPVPEMNGEQRVFLWETGVSDDVYTQMWNSIQIIGEKKDGTPYKNWIAESILSEDNIALPGSRAESLFSAKGAVEADVFADIVDAVNEAPAAAPFVDETADPLEGLL